MILTEQQKREMGITEVCPKSAMLQVHGETYVFSDCLVHGDLGVILWNVKTLHLNVFRLSSYTDATGKVIKA